MTFSSRPTCRRRAAGKSCAGYSKTSPRVGPSAIRLRWLTPLWLRSFETSTRRRRLERQQRHDPDPRDDDGARDAQAADRVNNEELERGEVQRKCEPGGRQPKQQQIPAALRERRRP